MTSGIKNNLSWNLAVTPREWQKKALIKWQDKLKGVVSVVTGGGKTLFSFLCILKFRKIFPEKSIIILVPTLTLLDQWYISLLEEFNVQESEIACFSSQEKSKSLKPINIFLINTGRKYLPKIKSFENYFLIVDECHRSGSAINSNTLKGNYAATLGLSATPKREYDDGFLRYIKPNLGDIIYEYDYKEALKDGVISPFELKNVEISFVGQEEKHYLKINKRLKLLLYKYEKDKSLGNSIKNCLIQRSRISSSALMRIPVTIKITEQFRMERLIIFHESIQAANEIAELLRKRKYPVSLYHSGISPILRRNNLQLYKRGIYNILVTCKALDEGMNVPETTIAIISSSTASIRQRVQRLGRVLRPAKGKQKATIFTLYITDQEKRRLIEEYQKFEDKIDIVWLKAKR